jgi:hypothetical protein
VFRSIREKRKVFEKEIEEKKKKIADLENSVSDKTAQQVYNEAIYDVAPLAYDMRVFTELSEQEIKSLKRIIAVSRNLSLGGILV